MKHLFSKHTSYRKEYHNFISLISLMLLICGFLSLLYLLAFCHLPDSGKAPFFCHVSASVKKQGEGKNEISDAVFLSRNNIHQISLSPYSYRYYYIVFQENCTLKILSGGSSIRVTCYSSNGSQMSIPKINHQYHFEKVSGNTLSSGDRIFLKFASASTKPCTVKVQYKKSTATNAAPNKTATPKPRKAASSRKTPESQTKTEKKKSQKKDHDVQTTPKPLPKATSTARKIVQTTPKPSPKTRRNAQATPKPSPNTKRNAQTTPKPSPTAKKKAPAFTVKPHFLRLALGTKKELSLSLGKTSLSLSDCTYFLTDSSVVSIQDNTILGKKEGITILYLRSKKSVTCSCCLIRITKT